MKNFIRRLLGRFHAVNHSDVLSYQACMTPLQTGFAARDCKVKLMPWKLKRLN
jgi:hypothetical protein